MTGEEWLRHLSEAVKDFERTRNVGVATVKVALSDGESMYLWRAVPGPGPFITLSPHPEKAGDFTVDYETPRAVIVRPELVTKIEILVEIPGKKIVGFES